MSIDRDVAAHYSTFPVAFFDVDDAEYKGRFICYFPPGGDCSSILPTRFIAVFLRKFVIIAHQFSVWHSSANIRVSDSSQLVGVLSVVLECHTGHSAMRSHKCGIGLDFSE